MIKGCMMESDGAGRGRSWPRDDIYSLLLDPQPGDFEVDNALAPETIQTESALGVRRRRDATVESLGLQCLHLRIGHAAGRRHHHALLTHVQELEPRIQFSIRSRLTAE